MAERKRMTRNQNHDDASTTNTINTCDNNVVAPWSDLNHDLLFLVMMRLGVIDFVAFGGVCKSWRSVAVANSNKSKFMASRMPMSVSISSYASGKKCYLEDFEGRKLSIILPHSAGRRCIGVTCGYLILFGEKTRDFWLVNPITRHQLHFPFPDVRFNSPFLVPILVFSPSISRWVFVMFRRYSSHDEIWFCIAGTREWTYVSTSFRIIDLVAFKGKIYVLDSSKRLSEVRFYPTPKVMLLEIKNFPEPEFDRLVLVSLGENLYVTNRFPEHPHKVQAINFNKMEWLPSEKIGEKYAFFFSEFNYGVEVTLAELWADLHPQYRRYAYTDLSGKGEFFYANMWYFFHDCLHVNFLHV